MARFVGTIALLSPTHRLTHQIQRGQVGRFIQLKETVVPKAPTLWNGALIALAARQIGATLVTRNVDDFELLRRYPRFELEVPPDVAP